MESPIRTKINKREVKMAMVTDIKEKPIIKYEIIGEDDKPITIKKSWWRRVFG